MPNELEDLTHLKTNNPANIAFGELRQRWSEENPKQRPEEFDAFYKTAQEQDSSNEAKWLSPVETNIRNFDEHWPDQRGNFTTLRLLDKKLSKPLEPDSMTQKAIYTGLRGVFGDKQMVFLGKDGSPLSKPPNDAFWMLPDSVGVAQTWNGVVADAERQVNRNGSRLASIIDTLKEVAGDELYRHMKADPKVDDDTAKAARLQWASDPLFYRLDEIQYKLQQWDAILAGSALPDPATMHSKATECLTAFQNFAAEHAKRYVNEPTPFIKYQLLATMGPLAEKVANQFAARLGVATFSAMYALIIDVPRSATSWDSRSKAVEIKNYGKSLADAWKKEMKKLLALDKKLKTTLPEIFDDKNQEKKKLTTAFSQWEKGYANLGEKSVNAALRAQPDMYDGTSTTAFQLRQLKAKVAATLADVPTTRDAVQTTLDGFISIIEIGIEDAQNVQV